MTHEELLAKIEWAENSALRSLRNLGRALRAVVELHKPWTNLEGKVVCAECCNYGADRQPPCPTIQAIEKELQ